MLGFVDCRAYQNYTSEDADTFAQVSTNKKSNKSEIEKSVNTVEVVGFIFELPESWTTKFVGTDSADLTPNVDLYNTSNSKYSETAKVSKVAITVSALPDSELGVKNDTIRLSWS